MPKERRTEANRELGDPHPEAAGREIMTALVDDHEDREPQDRDERVRDGHALSLAREPSSVARRRAAAVS